MTKVKNIKINDFLEAPIYKEMNEHELSQIIGNRIRFEDYDKLRGKNSLEKAKILYEKWKK